MHTTPGVWGFTVVAVAFVSASAAAQTTPRLEPIATFGCDDCDGPLLFSDVRELVWIDPDRLLVVDGDAPFLRVFIAAGEPITAFAREGAGPGELRTPMAAAVGGEDTIEVIDIRTLRLTRFSLAGDLIGWGAGRQVGGLLNVVALLFFLANTVYALRSPAERAATVKAGAS